MKWYIRLRSPAHDRLEIKSITSFDCNSNNACLVQPTLIKYVISLLPHIFFAEHPITNHHSISKRIGLYIMAPFLEKKVTGDLSVPVEQVVVTKLVGELVN